MIHSGVFTYFNEVISDSSVSDNYHMLLANYLFYHSTLLGERRESNYLAHHHMMYQA